MTVHKAMYGIDPILSEKIYLQDLAEKNKKTLILFDESDQAAVAMRTAIIDQSIENAIDDYEAQGDYSDEDLYEALCYKFDITNSKELLAENKGCVPDAILGISKILHERLA